MVGLLKKCIKCFIPYGVIALRHRIVSLKEKQKQFIEEEKQFIEEERQFIKDIRDYFIKVKNDKKEAEIVEIAEWFKKHYFSVFPYEFIEKYSPRDVGSGYDAECDMFFVFHQGKKMYFPKTWSNDQACAYYSGLCAEQNEESPHRYETKAYIVEEGDIIADMGAAEGIWALTYAEKAAKIYLFEYEAHWIEALQKTFEPWKEKVVIVNKYISDKNEKNKITLDEFFKDKEINFIKADIEGAEIALLKGGQSVLSRSSRLSLLLCAYHRHDDARVLKEMLKKHGFATEYSKRYMLFIYDKELKEPYVRRGLIRAKK